MKIIHISDLHFGMNNEWIIDSFLAVAKEINPDIIIVSGDLTHRATSEQYKLLLQFLNKLPGIVLAVPGNHDIPLWNTLARFINPFKKYNKYVMPAYKHHYQDVNARVLGINSVNPLKIKDGILSKTDMRQIKKYFNPSFDGLNIVFFHHNFDQIHGLHKPLKNYSEFLTYVKQSNIDIVCTGHLHYATINLIEKNNHKPCILMHAGSLLCSRSKDKLNSFYLIETNQQLCSIQWRVFKKDAFSIHSVNEIDLSSQFNE